jgi:hypothetical protein
MISNLMTRPICYDFASLRLNKTDDDETSYTRFVSQTRGLFI